MPNRFLVNGFTRQTAAVVNPPLALVSASATNLKGRSSLYRSYHHFIFGICETALSSISKSSSC